MVSYFFYRLLKEYFNNGRKTLSFNEIRVYTSFRRLLDGFPTVGRIKAAGE
ncbi:hypothetical protein BN1002_01328 [Bacillus sp. B-jedd]|nr:hypothetical protein BN1002_01328 [Bacillus sp. B-jedd]